MFLKSMILSHRILLSYNLVPDSPNDTQTTGRSLQSDLKGLYQKPVRFHHCKILAKFCILDFQFYKIHFYENDLQILKWICAKLFSNCIQKVQGCSRSTRAASNGDCKVPFHRTTFAQSERIYNLEFTPC